MPSLYDRHSVPYRMMAFSLSALLAFNGVAPVALAEPAEEDTIGVVTETDAAPVEDTDVEEDEVKTEAVDSVEEADVEEESSELVATSIDDVVEDVVQTTKNAVATFGGRPGGGTTQPGVTQQESFAWGLVKSNDWTDSSSTTPEDDPEILADGVVTVTNGGEAWGSGTDGAVKANDLQNMTIVIKRGFRLQSISVRCNDVDGYNCNTFQRGQVTALPVNATGEYVLSLDDLEALVTHEGRGYPARVLLCVVKDTVNYTVTYNAGILNGQIEVPNGIEDLVNTPYEVADLTDEAKADAEKLGYTFVGWSCTWTDPDDSTQTHTSTVQPGESAVILGNTVYTALYEKAGNLTIETPDGTDPEKDADGNVIANSYVKVYDGEGVAPKATSTTGIVEYCTNFDDPKDQQRWTTNPLPYTTVGEYEVQVRSLGSTGNKDAGPVTVTIKILPRPVTATGSTQKTYDGDAELEDAVTLALDGVEGNEKSGVVGDDDVTVDDIAADSGATYATANVHENLSLAGVGVALKGNDANNYTLVSVDVTGTIIKADGNVVTVEDPDGEDGALEAGADSYVKVYDAESLVASAKASEDGSTLYWSYDKDADEDDWTELTDETAPTFVNVTGEPVTVYFKATNPNYEDAYADATYEITKRPVTIYVEETRTYNGKDQTMTFDPMEFEEFTSQLVGGDKFVGAGSITGNKVGDYEFLQHGTHNISIVSGSDSEPVALSDDEAAGTFDPADNYDLSVDGLLHIVADTTKDNTGEDDNTDTTGQNTVLPATGSSGTGSTTTSGITLPTTGDPTVVTTGLFGASGLLAAAAAWLRRRRDK